MSVIALLQLILSVFNKVFSFIEREKNEKAGEVNILNKQKEQLDDRVKKSQDARNDVSTQSSSNGLRDDDGYCKDK